MYGHVTAHGCTSNTDKSAVNNPKAVLRSVFLHVELKRYTEQRGTGIKNGWNSQMERSVFDRTGPTERSGQPRKVGRRFRNFSGWTEPIHSVLDRNFRKFWVELIAPLVYVLVYLMLV